MWPVQHIVGVERDDSATRGDKVDAGAFDDGEAEIEPVEERHDGHAKDLVVAKVGGQLDEWQTAQDLLQDAGRALAGT